MFITVTDTDKAAATQLATRFRDLGFDIVATGGTAQAISRDGRARRRRSTRSARARPNVVDCIERGEVDLVINTPTGSGARTDGYEIRAAPPSPRDPLRDDDDGRLRGRRAIAAAQSEGVAGGSCSLQELHEAAQPLAESS